MTPESNWASGYQAADLKQGGFDLVASVVLYTHPDCSFSDALKDELNSEGTAYEEIDLARRLDAWTELEALTGGERITPVLVQGDAVSVGFHGVG